MSRLIFTQIPSNILELMTASRQIDREIAEQILHYAAEWSNANPSYQLDLINYLVDEVDTHGKYHWGDIVWDCLVHRINRLSSEINQKLHGISAAKR